MNTDPSSADHLLPADRRAMLAGLGGLAAGALIVGSRTAHAGPLNPPAGPVTPTGKTLTEVEPRIAINATNTPGDADSLFKITQPGSYYLTGNITGVSGKHGIEIAASGVTIDLNGFELVGAAGSLSGIATTTSSHRGVKIRNGTVRGWGSPGVDLATQAVIEGQIEHLIARENASTGIQCGQGFVLTHCTATNNGGSGLFAGDGSVVAHCAARTNSFVGISVGNGCTVSHSTAVSNGNSGIRGDTGNVFTNCTSVSNSGTGILAGPHCVVSSCTASSNLDDGISANLGTKVHDCTAINNTLNGIIAFGANAIMNCSAAGNDANGIRGSSDSLILGNSCDSNGNGTTGAGILLTSSDNRVEGNHCTDNVRGIDITSTGSIVLRNTCSGNTINFVLAASNRYGPIIDITASGTSAVSGNAATDTSGTTHPWANFAH